MLYVYDVIDCTKASGVTLQARTAWAARIACTVLSAFTGLVYDYRLADDQRRAWRY